MLAYDLAICLNAWCFERDFSYNLTKGQGMLKAYRSVRPLNDNEITAIPLLARGAALRFFLTRLYDWFKTLKCSPMVLVLAILAQGAGEPYCDIMGMSGSYMVVNVTQPITVWNYWPLSTRSIL